MYTPLDRNKKQKYCFIFKSSQNAMVDVSIRIVMIIALTTNHWIPQSQVHVFVN